ncbi:hypothetical protein M2323_001429 [Rhodoblastus acidophilus]|uniref:hypothetical protein n=1 Tax=Rhodoblastus acidophilus TaxID=1074 RepID=UPI0022257C9F|nr:hypothetical protein [Rhodoblastus acidophilus]MCW2283657.1 hypothetical protein [Rhodoblastus acidophilus]MCW2332517.1 hypothetical protein [Rhodoblastus acidophilus]
MADPLAISILRRKRDEIESAIAAYEAKIEEAKRDLSAVNTTLRLFELNGEPEQFPVYVEVRHLFKRGEIVKLCRAALAEEGPLDNRELALRVVRAKGLDEGDKVLRKSVSFRIVQALSMAARRGTVGDGGKRKGVRLWTTET